MYKYERALARSIGDSGVWSEPDLLVVPCNQIFRRYNRAYVVLSHPVLPALQTLDLTLVRSELETTDMQFSQWLALIGNTTLPTEEGTPELKKSKVRYGEAWDANYAIKATDHRIHPDTPVEIDQQLDLLLTREGLDAYYAQKHCLVSVCGVLHQTSASEYGLYVLSGGRVAEQANDNRVGIVNFQDIGSLETLPITPEMIERPVADLPLRDKVYLKLPKEHTGKIIIPVVLGIPLLGSGFTRWGDSVCVLHTNELKMIQRYYFARARLGYRFLQSTFGDDRRATEDLLNDEMIVKYLTQPQSFIVLLDAPELSYEAQVLESLGAPGRYATPTYPEGLLLGPHGQVSEYRVLKQRDVYVVAGSERYDPRDMATTKRHLTLPVQENQNWSITEHDLATGFMVDLTATRVEITK